MKCLGVDSNFSLPISNPSLLWSLRVAAIVALAGGILGSLYLAAGTTPLLHAWKILFPLQHVNFYILFPTLMVNVALSVGGVIALILLQGKSSQPIPQRKPPQPKRDHAALNLLKPLHIPSNNPHLSAVNQFLTTDSFSYLEHYGFYYHLSFLTEWCAKEPGGKAIWENFLEEIHGLEVYNKREGASVKIDCSIELQRLQGPLLMELEIDKLEPEDVRLESDIPEMYAFCCDAFSDFRSYVPPERAEEYFFQKGNTPYVIRNSAQKGEVIGCIVLQEIKKENGETHLFIHSLARKANATRIQMTEKLKSFFVQKLNPDKYDRVFCKVLRNNQPAQKIYTGLGFHVESDKGYEWTMVYTKPSLI